jgi:hypothetical protein
MRETNPTGNSRVRVSRAAAYLVLHLALVIPASCVQASQALEETKPIRLHPENPHYFEWRDEPTILITSGEHYGAVLNRAFNYKKYLNILQSHRLNLTRIFTGVYCEPAGAFNINDNTLAPAKEQFICPWVRSKTPGYLNGGNKFDLTKWDTTYFKRLRNFVADAGKSGVVVEVVLFCTFYNDSMWDLSPLNASNNINGIGRIVRQDVFTLKDKRLTAVQDAMVRKIVEELNDFDNVYFEICNEPYERGGQTQSWQNHVAQVIVDTEKQLPYKHLIAQNLPWRASNLPKHFTGRMAPNRHVSVLNFHGTSPPKAVQLYYDLNKIIAYDETGRGSNEKYRTEGWEFIIAGGAVYNNLDLSFTVGHENGTSKSNAPAGGGPVLLRQLGILMDFINGFDFIRMKPDTSVVQAETFEAVTVHALVEEGRAYAIYINGCNQIDLTISLPRGLYIAQWINTKTGEVDRELSFDHSGGNQLLRSPEYVRDIALRIVKLQMDMQ